MGLKRCCAREMQYYGYDHVRCTVCGTIAPETEIEFGRRRMSDPLTGDFEEVDCVSVQIEGIRHAGSAVRIEESPGLAVFSLWEAKAEARIGDHEAWWSVHIPAQEPGFVGIGPQDFPCIAFVVKAAAMYCEARNEQHYRPLVPGAPRWKVREAIEDEDNFLLPVGEVKRG